MVLLLTASADAREVAPWVPLDSFPSESRVALGKFREVYCTPEMADVSRPIFPDAVIVAIVWPKKKPHCDAPVSPEQFDGLELLSKEPPETVEKWYAVRLEGFTRFEVEAGVIFVKDPMQNFVWNRDYGSLPSVLIMPARELWKQGGYQSVIEFIRPAL